MRHDLVDMHDVGVFVMQVEQVDLVRQLGVQSLIVCGESTSGCVRASVVDGYSNGFHLCLVEECTYDRAELTHKVNLFDLHHKYADVMHVDEVVAHLDATRLPHAAE